MMVSVRNVVYLAATVLSAAAQVQHEPSRGVKVPWIDGKYTVVYRPGADRFAGPDTLDLKAGSQYAVWVPNDHAIVKGPDGRWNMFGITHPLTSLSPATLHAGEYQSFHALAPVGSMKDVVRGGTWEDLPKMLRAADRPGENPNFYAPYVMRRGALYYMFYGPNPIRLATSPDLIIWRPQGEVFSDQPSTRDPSVLFWQGTYYMVYCAENAVAIRTSHDLRHWSQAQSILRMTNGIAPESPSLIRHNGTFYLFVCTWNGIWDRKTVQGAYQHQTLVYQTDNLPNFDNGKQVATLDAHAPEVLQGENGQWYISSAEWPSRGVSIARLSWK